MIKLKHYYFLAGIIAVGFLLAAIIFRGCSPAPSHKDDIKEVQALQAQLKKKEQSSAADSARLVKRGDSLEKELHVLQNKKDMISKELTITKTKVQLLAAQNSAAKANKDTARYIETCDSLRNLATLQGEVITMYQNYADSVETNYEAQLTAKDSLLNNRASLIADLRNVNDRTNAELLSINTDYLKVTKKLKRERTLSRILAIATTTVGTLLITKKVK